MLNFSRSAAFEATPIEDVCASFQEAVVDVLVTKTLRAARRHRVSTVLMAGGVVCNERLRSVMREACEREGLALFHPRAGLCTDNALMVACAGTHHIEAGKLSGLDLDCFPVLSLVR